MPTITAGFLVLEDSEYHILNISSAHRKTVSYVQLDGQKTDDLSPCWHTIFKIKLEKLGLINDEALI